MYVISLGSDLWNKELNLNSSTSDCGDQHFKQKQREKMQSESQQLKKKGATVGSDVTGLHVNDPQFWFTTSCV